MISKRNVFYIIITFFLGELSIHRLYAGEKMECFIRLLFFILLISKTSYRTASIVFHLISYYEIASVFLYTPHGTPMSAVDTCLRMFFGKHKQEEERA